MKKEKLNKLYKKAVMLYYIAVLFMLRTQTVYAETFAESKLATGFVKLISDITAWLTILVPAVGGLTALYFFIRKNLADERDQDQWAKRLKNTGFCVIGGTVASAMISLIISYFK